MKNFEQQNTIYSERINGLLTHFSHINPDWVNTRDWFDELNLFELGEDFWSKNMHSEGVMDTNVEKCDFFMKIIVYAQLEYEQKIKKEKKGLKKSEYHIEFGMDIDPTIDNFHEQEEHHMLLDYIWWQAIKTRCLKAGQLSTTQFKELEAKEHKMVQLIKKIKSLTTTEQ